MPEFQEKLNFFTTAVLAEAARETEALLADAESARNEALKKAEDDALRASFALIRQEAARIRADAGRRVSEHMMDCKRALALRRDEISAAVFVRVTQRLAAFTATADYTARLRALFEDAAAALPEGAALTLFLRTEDLPLAGNIIGRRANVTPMAGDFALGGLVVACDGLRVDASFDALLNALRGQFSVSPRLDGEVG